MVNAYVVLCHPSHDSFTHAVHQRVLSGLERAGHQVRVSDLYADRFRPELDADDRLAHSIDHREHPERRPDIDGYAANLRWCDTLILVYPTWWSGQPAMLKGWFDRVFVTGVAYHLPQGSNRIRPLLANIGRIVAVTSHGSSKLVNALEGEAGKRIVTRSLRATSGLRCRTTWLALYGIDRSTPVQRQQFLDRVESRLSRIKARP